MSSCLPGVDAAKPKLRARVNLATAIPTSEVLVSRIRALVLLAKPSILSVPCVLVLIVLMGLY